MDVAPPVASHLVACASDLVAGFATASLAGMGFDRAAPLAGMLVASEAEIFPDEGVKSVQKAVFEHFWRDFRLPDLQERSACHTNVAKRCK